MSETSFRISNSATAGQEHEEAKLDVKPFTPLVAGRERRERAGNRYAQLLQLEQQKEVEAQENDDLALLFEENGEDNEFDVQAAVSDEEEEDDGDSSTDEEDKGPAAAEDELEGEKQLEKEERARQRDNKRKAEKALVRPGARRKRVKIDDNIQEADSSPVTPAERPRKKSERLSWLPSAGDTPVRASSRTLSVQNKQRTLESMKESDAKRARQIAVMEAANKRRGPKKKSMTQAERLAEATETERLNSKSLNKWEEMEKDRAEKQRARLEALQNRELKGPVIRWYSGPAEWVGEKLVCVGKKVFVEELPVKDMQTDKQKGTEEVLPSEDQPPIPTTIVVGGAHNTMPTPQAATAPATSHPVDVALGNITVTDMANTTISAADEETITVNEEPATMNIHQTSTFMDGLEYYASLPVTVPAASVPASTQVSGNTIQDRSQQLVAPIPSVQSLTAEASVGPEADISTKPPSATLPQQPPQPVPEATEPNPTTQPLVSNTSIVPPLPEPTPAPTVPKPPTPPPEPTITSTRNLIQLINFDDNAVTQPDIQRRILFKWPAPTASALASTFTASGKTKTSSIKMVSAYTPVPPVQALCAITGEPAKYRDPLTGLAYGGMEGFKTLRKLADGNGEGGVWSGLLGAWVGAGAARGVPDGFLHRVKKPGEVKLEGGINS